MRLQLLLAWRHLVFQPGRTAASVLGIAVGIATVVAVLVVDHNTLLTQEALRSPTDPEADLLIQPELSGELVFEEVAEDLSAVPELMAVTAFATGRYNLMVGGAPRGAVEFMAVEAGAHDDLGAYVVSEGADLDHASSEPQLLVTSGLAAQAELSVGDLVELATPPARQALRTTCVEGELVAEGGGARRAAEAGPPELHPFRVVGILAPTRLGYPARRVVTTFSRGRELLGRRLNPRFWADLDTSRTDLMQLTRQLGDRYVVTAPKRSLSGLAPEEKAFRNGVRLCGFLALFLGLYIIFNTMSMSLVERVRSIGLLRSLGLTNDRLLGTFLMEGLVLASLGAGLALLLAWGIVDLMVELKITTLGWGKPLRIEEWPVGPVVGVVAAGVLFCLAGVLYPFLRASRLSVIDALRRGVIELSRDPFTGVRRSVLIGLLAVVPVAWFIGAPPDEYVPQPLYEALLAAFGLLGSAFALLLLVPGLLARLASLLTAPVRGPAVVLARTTLATARHRVFGTVSGLMLVFTAIFLIVSVLESLKSEVRQFGDRALSDRLFVKTTPAGARRMGQLRKAEAEFRTLTPLNVETTSSFLVRAIDTQLLWVGSLADDKTLRAAFEDEPTIILSTRCADDVGKRAGDTVRMATRTASGIMDFRVLAVTDEYGFAPDDRVFGVVSTATMSNYWCLDGKGLGDDFVAWVPELTDARAAELQAVATEVLGDELLDFRRGEAITQGYVDDLERSFAIFYAILVLTVVLAAVGILNAMVIAVMERRREIGLLRAVGLTGGQVAAMLLLESGVLGVLGGVFGLVLGIPLAYLATDALTQVSHLELAYELSPRALSAVLGGAVLVSTLAVLWPALRANHLKLSEVIRYE